MSAVPVSVVVVFGRHSNTAASWPTADSLTGDGVAVVAFFPEGVPPRRPAAVVAHPIAATPRPARWAPIAWLKRLRLERQLSGLRGDEDPDPIWAGAAGDSRLLAAVRSADVLVAADRTAVPAVWHLMRNNRRADVVLGYGEAQRRITARLGRR